MDASYSFSNLCGAVYYQGNVVFTPDGKCVLSPVGNRVALYDLVKFRVPVFALLFGGGLSLCLPGVKMPPCPPP
mgnify:CR=1 FL=1